MPVWGTSTATNPQVVEQPWPFARCPSCTNDRFVVGSDLGALVTFSCTNCGQRWRYLVGVLLRVPEHTWPERAPDGAGRPVNPTTSA